MEYPQIQLADESGKGVADRLDPPVTTCSFMNARSMLNALHAAESAISMSKRHRDIPNNDWDDVCQVARLRLVTESQRNGWVRDQLASPDSERHKAAGRQCLRYAVLDYWRARKDLPGAMNEDLDAMGNNAARQREEVIRQEQLTLIESGFRQLKPADQHVLATSPQKTADAVSKTYQEVPFDRSAHRLARKDYGRGIPAQVGRWAPEDDPTSFVATASETCLTRWRESVENLSADEGF